MLVALPQPPRRRRRVGLSAPGRGREVHTTRRDLPHYCSVETAARAGVEHPLLMPPALCITLMKRYNTSRDHRLTHISSVSHEAHVILRLPPAGAPCVPRLLGLFVAHGAQGWAACVCLHQEVCVTSSFPADNRDRTRLRLPLCQSGERGGEC